MSVATVEQILAEIAALPLTEQARLRQLLEQQAASQEKEPLGKFVAPLPVPDPRLAMQWLRAHAEMYQEQWVALDGERLIAHGVDYEQVSECAKASGAHFPLITFIEAPPAHPFVRV